MDSDQRLAKLINGEFRSAVVHYVADGEEGLKIAMEAQFDLIVMDCTLSKKDGLSVLQELRGQKILTPVLMVTAENSVKNIVHSLDSGANDCVIKPFEIHVLVARMKALLRRSKWDLCAEVRHDHIGPKLSISILIIDQYESSDAAMARLIATKLPNLKITVAENHQSGLELYASNMIDIVIPEVGSKEIDLYTMIESMCSIKKDIKIIITDKISKNNYPHKVYNISNAMILSKPLDECKLLSAIECNLSQIC
jgi:DNA-binding response OmpR family regulator